MIPFPLTISLLLLFILGTSTSGCEAENVTLVQDISDMRLAARAGILDRLKYKMPNPPVPTFDYQRPFHQRIIAVGDFHGDFRNARKVLELSGVVDSEGNWSGSVHVFVQLGDVIGGGPDTRKLITFLEMLRRQAQIKEGNVFTLMGKHEFMNLLGDWRYVPLKVVDLLDSNAGERGVGKRDLRSFGGWQERWKEIRGWIGGIWADKYITALRLPLHPSIGAPNTPPKSRWSKSTSLCNAALSFVHGGLSPHYLDLTPFPTKINDISKKFINKLRRREISKPTPPNTELVKLSKSETTVQEDDLWDEEGPLRYDGWARTKPDSARFCKEVDDILKRTGTRRMIIAPKVHTEIRSRCNGKVFLIDTGISYWSKNTLSWLMIDYSVTPAGEQGGFLKLEEKEVVHAMYVNNRAEKLVDITRTIDLKPRYNCG
ncbi:hypothetical protein APHAL10511_005467 [Amanita phalloides]|nr:hypothetical protein APHAL10511_005467 [Amanita phalloides]